MGGPTKIDLQYVYNVGTNNGQIAQMNDVVSGEQTVYAYDSLKRLVQAQASVSLWGQAFGYDGWGNLLSKAATPGHSGTSMSLTVAAQSNQPTNQGFAFDGNGNATSLPNVTSMPTGYDVENRMGGDWYDQWNQPLERGGVWNEYGLNGERLGTYSYGYTTNCMQSGLYLICQPVIIPTQVSRNIYFGGRLIQSNGLTVATDRLGSARMDENGHRAEFFPYGEAVANSLTSPDLFATYARDSGTGLDYAGQRWYTSTYGRFNRPDPSGTSAHIGSPSSWNRYAYVLGDPIGSNDPSGLDCGQDSLFGFCSADDGSDVGSNGDSGTDGGGGISACDDPANLNPNCSIAPAQCADPACSTGGAGNGFLPPILVGAGAGGIGIGIGIWEGGCGNNRRCSRMHRERHLWWGGCCDGSRGYRYCYQQFASDSARGALRWHERNAPGTRRQLLHYRHFGSWDFAPRRHFYNNAGAANSNFAGQCQRHGRCICHEQPVSWCRSVPCAHPDACGSSGGGRHPARPENHNDYERFRLSKCCEKR